MSKLNETADARAQALAAVKQICSYIGGDGRTMSPGDPGYQPSWLAAFGNESIGSELHLALTTGNEDGLNALLDRWWSANKPQETEGETKTVGQSLTALGEEIEKNIDKVFALVAPEEFLISKVRNRPVGGPNANALLKR